MIFTLKKCIFAFLMPFPIGLFLLFFGLFFLFKKSYTKAKIFLFLGFFWFFLLSFQPISNAILKPLEDSHKALLNIPKVEYILVLGSGHKSNDDLSITSEVNEVGINRLVEGIRIYNELKTAKLIVSGYSSFDKNSHALMQEKLAISLGVKKEDIIRFDSPKDTKEEAIKTKKLIGDKNFILITSATHMKRAYLLFKKEGLNSIPAPTNHLSYSLEDYNSYFSAKNFYKVQVAWHEYLGLIFAWLKNHI